MKTADSKLRLNNQGFTLIELLVVIAIIGLLSSIVLASLNTARAKARDAKRMEDLAQIRTALELYYSDHGYYPPAHGTTGGCPGWDCNGYNYSIDGTWANFQEDLAPYMSDVPVDPINNCGGPWNYGCYSYSYGNVGRSGSALNPNARVQYDLTAQLEDPNSPYRCASKQYTLFFDNQPWCGPYTGQVYEASPD